MTKIKLLRKTGLLCVFVLIRECMHLICGYSCIVGLVVVKHVYLGLFLEPKLKPGDPCTNKTHFCANHLLCKQCLTDSPYICMSGNHNMQLNVKVCFVVRV